MPRPRLFFAGLTTALLCSLAAYSAQTPAPERDDTGATPLMYAAAFESIDVVKGLLAHGADVNAAADNGATALMWGANDPAKLRLLLDRGANVNARAEDGTTPLVAAVHRGNTESMHLLLERGADPKASPDALVQAAYLNTNPEPRRILKGIGITAAHIGQVAPALARIDQIDAPFLRELLDLGLDANTKFPFVTVQVPILGYASFTGNVDMVQLLLDRGADVNASTNRLNTPLMMAAASNIPNPALVTLLLTRGARINDRDDMGRTALDWALLQGETAISKQLRAAGATAGTPAAGSPAVVAHARESKAAMQLALSKMDTIGPAFNTRTRCASCHNQSLPAIARQAASAKGVPLAPDVVSHPTQATQKMWDAQRNAFMVGRCGGQGFVQSTGYGLASMAAQGAPRTKVTDATASCLATRQFPDGSWPAIDVRPPLGGSPIVFTALALRGLDVYIPPALRAGIEPRLALGRDFLRMSNPRDTQDAAFKLLGLVWTQAPHAEIARSATMLRELQRADGGWGQVTTMAPDAYATGQALYALAASGMPQTDPVYKRGVEYLLKTQLEDGSWFVQARGFPFQPYYDYGFPHQTNQFISAAATSWAVMAIAQ